MLSSKLEKKQEMASLENRIYKGRTIQTFFALLEGHWVKIIAACFVFIIKHSPI